MRPHCVEHYQAYRKYTESVFQIHSGGPIHSLLLANEWLHIECLFCHCITRLMHGIMGQAIRLCPCAACGMASAHVQKSILGVPGLKLWKQG